MERDYEYIKSIIQKILWFIFLFCSPVVVFSQNVVKTQLTFPFEIVENQISENSEYSSAKIYIFLEEKYFNRNNLQDLFDCFSRTSNRSLSINVFTDREILLLFIKAEKKGIPDFAETPETNEVRKEFFSKNYPPDTGYFSAFYSKNTLTEFFQYNPLKDDSSWITVTIKDSNKFIKSENFLFSSIKIGYLDAVKWVLEKGISPNSKEKNGSTPLMWSVLLHHNDVANILISNGSDINSANSEGLTSLMYAVDAGNYEGVKLLTNNKANVNAVSNKGRTALMASTFGCNLRITKLLLENGANVYIKDSQGKTAISYACDNKEIVELLSNSKSVK